MRIHCLENVDKALHFLKEQRVHLENIGPHDIVNGNQRLILGLIWTIILRFQVCAVLPNPKLWSYWIERISEQIENILAWQKNKSVIISSYKHCLKSCIYGYLADPLLGSCFQMQDIIVETKGSETRSAKDALLLWCQMKTAGWVSENCLFHMLLGITSIKVTKGGPTLYDLLVPFHLDLLITM